MGGSRVANLFRPHPKIEYEKHRRIRDGEVKSLLDSWPLIGRGRITHHVRWRIETSATYASHYLGLGIAADEIENRILPWCYTLGILGVIAKAFWIQPPNRSLITFAAVLATGTILFVVAAQFCYDLLKFILSAAPSSGSFIALIIPILLCIAVKTGHHWGATVPHHLYAALIVATFGTLIWTGGYLFMECVLSLFAAGSMLWLRRVAPAEDVIDLLAKATMQAERLCDTRLKLALPNGPTHQKCLERHIKAAAEYRRDLLWQLEAIARRMESDLVRVLMERRNRATAAWLRGEARARAAYVRGLKAYIVMPRYLMPSHSKSNDPLCKALGTMLFHAASGHWGAIEKRNVPQAPPPSRIWRLLVDILLIVGPLAAIFILWGTWLNQQSSATQTPVIVFLAGFSLARAARWVDPDLDKDLAIVKPFADWFPNKP